MVDAAAAEPSNRDSNPQFEKLVPRTGDTDDGDREKSRFAEPGRMAASSSQSIHPVMVAGVIVVASVDPTVKLDPSAVAGGSARDGPQALPPSSAAPLTAGS